jgi:hypothetical protein
VTEASEDESSVDVAGRRTPASKRSKDRHIRSAWGVVKRAMHLQDSDWGSQENQLGAAPADHRARTWVPVVEVSLAESRSHASLVDDLLRSS